MITIDCPHCTSSSVVRFGFTSGGSQRLRCKDCGHTFSPRGKSAETSPERVAQIERALMERISQRGIARMLHVGRDTIRKVRKRGRNAS